MLSNILSSNKFSLWLGWLVVNALGGALGGLPCAVIGVGNLTNYPQIIIFALTIAISVSTCQAKFIQQQYIPKERKAIVTLWISLSSFCSALMIIAAPFMMLVAFVVLANIQLPGVSQQIGQHLFFGLMFLPFGLISGVITGFAQHFVLPGAAGKSKRRWILYSRVGAGLGLGISAVVVSILFKEAIFILSDPSGSAKSLGMFGITVFSTIAGIINGAVTGVEIVRLFGEQYPRVSSVHEE